MKMLVLYSGGVARQQPQLAPNALRATDAPLANPLLGQKPGMGDEGLTSVSVVRWAQPSPHSFNHSSWEGSSPHLQPVIQLPSLSCFGSHHCFTSCSLSVGRTVAVFEFGVLNMNAS